MADLDQRDRARDAEFARVALPLLPVVARVAHALTRFPSAPCARDSTALAGNCSRPWWSTRSTPVTRVTEHLEACVSCRSHYDFERAFLEAVRASADLGEEFEPLRERVVAALAVEGMTRS